MAEKAALVGKVALVTGAGIRIGRSIALRLAAEGADVVVNYRKSADEANEVVAKIEADGRKAVAIQADVTKRAEVKKMFAAAMEKFGRVGYSGEQRRNIFRGEIRGNHRRAVGRHSGHELEIAISVRAGRGAHHEETGKRANRQHFLARRNAGVAGIYALLRVKGRSDHADALPVASIGAGNSGEQRGAGDHSVSGRGAG